MNRPVLVACAILALPLLTGADPVRRQRPHGHSEVEKDRRALHDDLRDADQVNWLLREYAKHVTNRNWRGMRAVEAQVADALDDELSEAGRQTWRAAGELQRSDQGVHEKRRELRRDRHEGRTDRLAYDQRELAEERADRADDRRDLVWQEKSLDRLSSIRDEWARLRELTAPARVQRKQQLLQELLQIAQYEVQVDKQELREDRDERWREHQSR